MATKNYVPRADGEGQIGTSLKRWLKGVFINLSVSSYLTDGSYITSVAEIKGILNEYELTNPAIDIYNLEGV